MKAILILLAAATLATVTGCSKHDSAVEIQRQLFEQDILQKLQADAERLPAKMATAQESRDHFQKTVDAMRFLRSGQGHDVEAEILKTPEADMLAIANKTLKILETEQRTISKATELIKLDLELRRQRRGKEADRILADIVKHGQDYTTNTAAGLLKLRQSVTNLNFYAKSP